MFFIIEKSEETTFEFLQNSINIIQNENSSKIMNLLNKLSNKESKFGTKKWYVIDSQIAKGQYNEDKSIKLETGNVKSSLCDYSDALILIARVTTVNTQNNTDVPFKNCAPFSACKTEIYDVLIDEANYIYIAMPM